MKKSILVSLCIVVLCSCAGASVFPELGSNIAAPISLAVDEVNAKLFIVNSNSKILYNWEEGSFQELDITNPLAPTLLSTLQTKSFSGETYIDNARGWVYMSNRYSLEDDDPDRLYVIDLNAATSTPLILSENATAKNPFALACCYPDDKLWIGTGENVLQYWEIGSDVVQSMSLLADIDNGSAFTEVETFDVIINENQAFLSRREGGVLVVNLDESDVYAVDYVITNVGYPRGLHHDGTYLYLTTLQEDGDDWKSRVLVVDIQALTPRTDNTTAALVNDDDGLIIATIDVEDDPWNIVGFDEKLWVSCDDGEALVVISKDDYSILKTITIKGEPFSIASYTTPDSSKYIYVGSLEDNIISIIDVSTLEIAATYP